MMHIENGSGLSIANTDTTLPLIAAVPLQLTTVLHEPQIIKSLISVSQLIKDNKVTVEFSHNSYFIKDQHTKEILLHDTLLNGLYVLHLPLASSQFFSVITSSSDL
jgi:hypothetical protein